MRYNKVLLVPFSAVDNPFDNAFYFAKRPPAGVGYLSESLIHNDIEHEVFDMCLGYKLDELKSKIKEYKPDMVGISMTSTFMYKKFYHYIRELKEMKLNFDIVGGGAHVSTLQQQAMEECEALDMIVISEGEETLLELCLGEKPLNEIKGLIYRDNGKIVSTGRREFIMDIDRIPFPKYDKFEMNKYIQKEIGLVTSRGCPYGCIFCAMSASMGKKIRTRSPQNTVDEIEYWAKREYRDFIVLDDNFTFDVQRVFDICDEIEKRDLGYLQIRVDTGVRADKVSKKMFERMRQVGIRQVKIAAEGGNNKILKSLNKAEKIESISKAIEEACEAGLNVCAIWVIGAPVETWADIEDSFRLAEKYPIFQTEFNNLIPFPNTKLYEWIEKNNYFIVPPEVYLNDPKYLDFSEPVFETPLLSAQERRKAFAHHLKLNKLKNIQIVERKLKEFGFLGKIAGRVVASNLFRKLYSTNRAFRQIMDLIRHTLEKREDKKLIKR